jgi:hypothetical protein
MKPDVLKPDVLKTGHFENRTFCRLDVPDVLKADVFKTGHYETGGLFVGVPRVLKPEFQSLKLAG